MKCPWSCKGELVDILTDEEFVVRDYLGLDYIVKAYNVPISSCSVCGEGFSGVEAAKIRWKAVIKVLCLTQDQIKQYYPSEARRGWFK